MKFIICLLLLTICFAHGYPDSINPNLEYELISGGPQVGGGPGPSLKPVTHKPMVINTPPPVDPNSKTFSYDAKTKTWTVVKQTDPVPAEDTLLWNQSNDKWLTQTARV